MNNNFFNKLEEKLMPLAAFMGQQKHLLAVRDGICTALPFTLIGSVLLIIGCPPYDPANQVGIEFLHNILTAWCNWAAANSEMLWTPYYATMSIMSLFVVVACAFSLAKAYDKNALNYAVSSLASFILISSPCIDGATISITNFSSKGFIIAMFVAFFTVETMRFVEDKGWTIKMPKGVPAAVANSFTSLLPYSLSLVLIYALSVLCQVTTGMIIPDAFNAVFTYIRVGIDNIFSVSVLTAFENLLFSFGVHPTTVTGPLLDTLEQINIEANAELYAAGLEPIHIYNGPFWAFFAAIGGGGSTLALAIMCLKSKSEHIRKVGGLSLVPAIFNINEPIIFGLPIFMNPILVIPFMIAPVVNIIIAWIATAMKLVNVAVVYAPWTSPAPIGAMVSCLDWRAAVLCILLIVLDAVIYYPFMKMYEKELEADSEK